MGGSRLLNSNNYSGQSQGNTNSPRSYRPPDSSNRQNPSLANLNVASQREDDSGNGSQGSDSFHSQNIPQTSNLRKNELEDTQTKPSGRGLGSLIQRTFFRKGSRRKNKNKNTKGEQQPSKLEISGSIRGGKAQPSVYGGHFNGGGSISSRRRASQKRRRRLSNARRLTKKQEIKNRPLTKADIGQPIPMAEEEKQNVISAKQWPTNPLKISKSIKGDYSFLISIFALSKYFRLNSKLL